MKLFTCHCKWQFLIGKKKVFGPIFEDRSADSARIMPYEEFKDGYGDCWGRYVRENEATK